MEFLLEKTPRHTKHGFDLDPEKDPILEFMGGISHGSLTKGIDSDLFGENIFIDERR